MDADANDISETPLNPPRRSRWKMLALSAALVGSGVFIGSGLTLIGIRSRLDEFRARPDLLSQRMVERMEKDLSLTPKQTDEIRKIFADTHDEADAMRQRSRAQAQAFFREFQGKVAQVLTPAQQKEWEDWFRRARERAMRGRSGGPGGDHDEKRGPRPDRGFKDSPPRVEPEVEVPPPPPGIPENHVVPRSNADEPPQPQD